MTESRETRGAGTGECESVAAGHPPLATSPPELHQPRGKSQRWAWIVAVVLLGLAAVTHIDGLFGALHCDGSAWLYMAQQRDRGSLPYRDLWENKLPPIFLVYRLAWKSGFWRELLYVLDVGLIAASAWFLWRAALIFLRMSAALTAACVYILATAHPALHYGGAITEAFALPLAVLGTSFAMLYRRAGGKSYPVLAGLAWSWAVAFRMPAILSALALIPLLAGKGLVSSQGTRLNLLAGMTGGAFVGVVLVLLDPLVAGYAWELIDVCVVWAFRYAVHDTPSFVSWAEAWRLFARNLLIWGGLHAAAALGLLCGVARLHRRDAWTRIAVLCVLCWYLGDLLSTFPTLHQYAHNHYMTLASCSLGAALLCDTRLVWPNCPRRLAFVPGIILIGYSCWTLTVSLLPKTREHSAVAGVAEAAEYLRRVTGSDERLLFWVWLDEAELLWRLDRPSASPHFSAPAYFMTDVELAQRSAAEFLAQPPRYAADSSPYLPLLGMPPDVIPTTRYEVIRAGFRDLYKPVAQFGKIVVYRRSD
jgi:hypothetical protein